MDLTPKPINRSTTTKPLWRPLLFAGLLSPLPAAAQDCGLLDFNCAAVTDAQLKSFLFVALILALLYRAYVQRTKAKLPNSRRGF